MVECLYECLIAAILPAKLGNGGLLVKVKTEKSLMLQPVVCY